MLEHPIDEPLRLAHTVRAVGVGITPGECCQRHAAVIVRVEATCPVPASHVNCLHMVREGCHRDYRCRDAGVIVFSQNDKQARSAYVDSRGRCATRGCQKLWGYRMLSHRRNGVVDAHTAISRRIDKTDVDVAAAEHSGGYSRLLGAPVSVRQGNVVGRRAVPVTDELHVFVGGENKRCRVV